MRSILVGVDGSDQGLRAVECAAYEALCRGSRLTLLSVYDDTLAGAVSRWPSDLLREEAAEAAATAEERARAIGPDLDVEVEMVAGSPAEALLDRARDAAIVVVGSQGLGGFPGMRIGSVAYQVAAHAPGQVLVVGAGGTASESSETVVGVDGSLHADSALVAALEEASHHGGRVRAVWAWSLPGRSATVVRPWARENEDVVEAAQRRALDEALARRLPEYPDVEVVREVVRAQPMAALLAATDGARMIVVGARGARGFSRLALGGVAHALLHHAPCPVLVVHRG